MGMQIAKLHTRWKWQCDVTSRKGRRLVIVLEPPGILTLRLYKGQLRERQEFTIHLGALYDRLIDERTEREEHSEKQRQREQDRPDLH